MHCIGSVLDLEAVHTLMRSTGLGLVVDGAVVNGRTYVLSMHSGPPNAQGGKHPSHGDGGCLQKGWRMVPVAKTHKVRGVASPSPEAWTWLGGGSDSWVADMAHGVARHPSDARAPMHANSGYRLRRPPRCPTGGYWTPRWSGGGGGINSHDTRHGGPGSYIHR